MTRGSGSARRAVPARLGRLAAGSIAAGLVVALAWLPVVGGLGLASAAVADQFTDLPAVLRVPPVPERSRILAADGSVLATFYEQNRQPVALGAVSPLLRTAVVDVEDTRFYSRHGIDVRALGRAARSDVSAGAPAQGASTITEQYVKNALVTAASTPAEQQAARGDTLHRKLQEARYALELEATVPRDTILSRYLNIAYFGDGAYGIEAAAEHYFSVHAAGLSLPQAALLAGLVNNPTGDDPVVHPKAARARRAVVLARMVTLGHLSRPQAAAASRQPIRLHLSTQPDGCRSSTAPFFCSWIRSRLLADPALGSTPAQRQTALLTGGLTIATSLDPATQAAAQHAVDTVVPAAGRVAGAVDVVQPGTGGVLAMAADRRYGTGPGATTLNLATGGQSGFQAGSTFKLFTLAAALDQQIPTGLSLPSPPTYTATGLASCDGTVFPPYTLHNAEAAEGGTYNLASATWESVNTYYAQLEQRTGICAPAQLAAKLGVRRLGGRLLAQVPSFTLGTSEVSPLDMAGAYATVAASGLYCPSKGVLSVTDRRGHRLQQAAVHCTQVLAPDVAAQVTAILTGVIDGPDPNRTGASASIGRPAAGKTGTTDNFSAAWFDGYTPTAAAAVWVGDPAGGFGHPLTDVTVGGRFYHHVYGADLPAAIWAQTLSALAPATS